MSHRVLGTCSICGGRVTVPDAWLGIYPPIPACESCGAHKKQPHGPVIDMEPAAKPSKKASMPYWDGRVGQDRRWGWAYAKFH